MDLFRWFNYLAKNYFYYFISFTKEICLEYLIEIIEKREKKYSLT